MILLAVSDVVWNALIVAVAGIVLAYMNHRAAERATKAATDAAEKVEQVKVTLETTTETQGRKLDTVAEGVEIVKADIHKVELATNSLTDRLVEKTGREGYERGGREERERADERRRTE